MFISFEGIDGCGKSTQLEFLATRLRECEYSVCTTREPGGTALAETIRNYLLHSAQPLDGRAELLLFGAARAQHVAEVIRPALQRKEIVLSDRFGDSSVAYQSGGLGLDREFILKMNTFATQNLEPDRTFFLKIDPLLAQARRETETTDRIEKRGLAFQTRVHEEYLRLAQENPIRIVTLDANQSRENLHAKIVASLASRGLKL